MNRFAVLALCCPLLAASGSLNALRAQGLPKIVGGYQVAALDAPLVIQAKEFIQDHLSILRLGEIQEAYTQVVAGTNVKFVCTVSGEGEPAAPWEFVAWRQLNGVWRFQSARRL